MSKTKSKCSWCTKDLARKSEFYKDRWVHPQCKVDWIKWEKNVCTACKINFSTENPEHKKSKMHKDCFELMNRRKAAITKPFNGGTGSKK